MRRLREERSARKAARAHAQAQEGGRRWLTTIGFDLFWSFRRDVVVRTTDGITSAGRTLRGVLRFVEDGVGHWDVEVEHVTSPERAESPGLVFDLAGTRQGVAVASLADVTGVWASPSMALPPGLSRDARPGKELENALLRSKSRK